MTSPCIPAEDQNEKAAETADNMKAMALVGLAANFGKVLPEPLFNLWLDLLAPYPAEVVREAVKNVILGYEYKTLPPFAVLREEIDALRGAGARGLKLQATAEWGALMTEMAKRGSYRPPERLHPVTLYVLKLMGGWHVACAWTEDSLEFKRRAFIAHWIECQGKVPAMELGAAGLRRAVAIRRAEAEHVGGGLRALLEGENRQPTRGNE